MELKSGKDEIVYLLTRVFEKYEQSTGQEVIRNTNRKNYEDLARLLSKISNDLPNTADTLQHAQYPPDHNPKKLEYPYLKYDITGGQIKDAYNGIVSNPRHFLVDACYIYLYGVGRKGFEKNPTDEQLVKSATTEETATAPPAPTPQHLKKTKARYSIAIGILFLFLALCGYGWYKSSQQWAAIKKDMKIMAYQPTQPEIDSLTGIWLVYIGSPQARVSDHNRYHMVVTNIVDIKYHNGYFTFNRYGASFDHDGYMQFENPNVVSIHSYVKNNTDTVESPRLSLMRFNSAQKRMIVISASWNFDVGEKNDILGIREVYLKQGNGGNMEEVINTIENSSCRCKILRWHNGHDTRNFYLRNESIDSLSDKSLKALLDENSILLRQPEKGIVLTAPGDNPSK